MIPTGEKIQQLIGLSDKLTDRPAVMIVDDVESNRFLIKTILRVLGVEIIEAENGEQAIEKAHQAKNLALIFLDIEMPGIDGYQVAETLMHHGGHDMLPIIFLTAVHCSNENIIRGYDVGAIDYITKPVKPAILKAKANQFVNLWKLRRGLEREIQERISLEEKTLYLANHDPLTGLPNRRNIQSKIEQSISIVDRNGGGIGIYFIDLDGFKYINDNFGHSIGDEVLKVIAERYQSIVRKTDVVARFGGDEFIILVNNFDEHSDHLVVLEKLLAASCIPVSIGENDEQVVMSASIGVANYPELLVGADILLDYADVAMYKAKDSGKNKYYFFSQKMDEEIHERAKISKALKQVVKNEQLTVYFQPIINASTKQIVGMEALVRWIDDELGFVPPDVFIPIAEHSGLIMEIGNQVFKKSLQSIEQIKKQMGIELLIAVNASSVQFASEKWYEFVKEMLNTYDVKAANIEIEITERLLLDDSSNVNDQLQSFRNLGVKLSVDDFGTGFSSLSYLKRCPVNTVKIDRSFVMDLPDDKDDVVLVQTIVAMAHGLGLEVISEGVETDQQLDFLAQQQSDFCQGYGIARPMPLEQLCEWLTEHKEQCKLIN